MQEIQTPRIFVSYSHETELHTNNVRMLADFLIQDYGIDVIGDFYEEDNPTGGLLTYFMQNCKNVDRIIAIISPTYKIKANEGKGGVGYESTIITDDLYKNITSDKVIPVIIDSHHSIENSCPDFLMGTRKALIISPEESLEKFAENIARIIHKLPENPKPALGKNKLLQLPHKTQVIEDINIEKLFKDNERLLNTAKYFANNDDTNGFNALFNKIKNYTFKELSNVKDKHHKTLQQNTNSNLPEIMDDFIESSVPLLLVALGGIISSNKRFQSQEGLLIDILSIDNWWQQGGYDVLRQVPELLAFVYHNLYGAMLIDNGRLNEVSLIFKQKIPVEQPSIQYEYLYKVPSVTGFIQSLGRGYIDSFKYILNAYNRWPWLALLFENEQNWKQALTSYQMTINILFYFQSLQENTLTTNKDMILSNPVIPPSFILADRQYKNNSFHFLIKNSVFFKNYLTQLNITPEEALLKWKDYLIMMGYFLDYSIRDLSFYDNTFIDNLLK